MRTSKLAPGPPELVNLVLHFLESLIGIACEVKNLPVTTQSAHLSMSALGVMYVEQTVEHFFRMRTAAPWHHYDVVNRPVGFSTAKPTKLVTRSDQMFLGCPQIAMNL